MHQQLIAVQVRLCRNWQLLSWTEKRSSILKYINNQMSVRVGPKE